ncbi:MAG TPA: GFA family protein [Gammaproteobacteria bacterium]|nr:GFA family protein [Gammaproteobacteria bacterium]
MKGGSGQPITRRFCPTCGSRVTATASVMPGVLMVTASSLDDPESFVLQMSIYAAQAPSWDQPPATAPVFPGMPPQN